MSALHRESIRNVAIIAHVDHGKTTLVDALFRELSSHVFREGESLVMDSNPLERERGITIFSKNASFQYGEVRINIVDTPGHADFGSEVERVLTMVDGVLLLVDAVEGPMPQTKFVLRKSLELGLRPVVVINKIDREKARPVEAVNTTFDLFCDLNATEEQLNFPIVYASAKECRATLDVEAPGEDMRPLLDAILKHVPPPIADPKRPFQMLVTMLDDDPHVGRIATGRIFHGIIRLKDPMVLIQSDGSAHPGTVTRILTMDGLRSVEVQEARAGEIVSIAGAEQVEVGDTLASPTMPEALPTLSIDEPTISMTFSHNTGPLAGRDGGRFMTSPHLHRRLEHEARVNVGLKVEPVVGGNRMKVSGRGELHLVVLIETLRREGFELEISRPVVILKEVDGKLHEPVEEVVIEVEPGYQGAIIQAMGNRRAKMTQLETSALGMIRMIFFVASRALIGFLADFRTMTRGTGIMHQQFHEYQPHRGELPARQSGVMSAHAEGRAVAYALFQLQDRGEIFVRPGDALYGGMIVGTNNKGVDLVVNAMREKKLTNMRAAGSDEALQLVPPREMTLEFALQFIADDELVEVTPRHIRLRKRVLGENERKKSARAAAGL